MPSFMPVRIISIEGNIGSGKSTLLNHLKEHFAQGSPAEAGFAEKPNVVFLKEPVDEWGKIQDENGVTMLEKFYADQEKYSFPFQMMAYISRLKLLKTAVETAQPNTVIISERSLYTDKLVFAKMLYDTGKIEHINYQIYKNWFDAFIEDFPLHTIIYVKANPTTCHERIHKRARSGESLIPLEYLTQCDQYHEQMMDDLSNMQVVLDGNVDVFMNPEVLQSWFKIVETMITMG